MTDETEQARRGYLVEVNAGGPPEGAETWDTAALQRDFDVQGFMAPFVVVVRKADGKRGTLTFTHSPRVYFNFVEA